MATPTYKRQPIMTLGWQSWSLVVVVLVIVLILAVYLVVG